ncbi:c-type cytochrome [Teichococcus deserti]|uniref:c-type cytochrome n=1 Tax=Teichococcus deserti TaxID=1817963 RepID=UPI001F623DB1|nr:c-type cytochrome [Pseudoroseomonas deserti]
MAVSPGGIGGRPPPVEAALGHPFQNNAWQVAQGKRLYAGFGCPTCHGDGRGGGSGGQAASLPGPSLMDGWWNYGQDPVTLYLTLRDGRPGGMPAFRDRLPPEQLWQLVGYLQHLGAYRASLAAPGRDDAPQTRPAENRAPAAQEPR